MKRIRETRVPLLKFEFYGIDIDISYVQIPEEIKNNKNWMDEALNNAMNNTGCAKSNGPVFNQYFFSSIEIIHIYIYTHFIAFLILYHV